MENSTEKDTIKYLQAGNLLDLERTVNNELKSGEWELFGTVQIIQAHTGYNSHFIQCIQNKFRL